VKITAQEEYGLRCLLQLARHEGPEPLTVGQIAEAEGISMAYVGKLLSALRQDGLVESVRGRSGGFVLSAPADQISVGRALRALGGQLFEPEFCATHPGANEVCVHLGSCSIRSLWSVVGDLIDRVLAGTTLADLVDEEAACRRLEAAGQELQSLLAPPRRAGEPPARAARK
jgi:Rrf2 family protein